MIYVFGKGSKERKVPFGGIACQHLNTYLVFWSGELNDAENEYVFLGAFGRPITRFAVNAIKRGMPTAALRDLLGYESWSMMEVYVQLAEQDVKDIYIRKNR